MMNNSKTIWIINQYAGTPQTKNSGRHFYIAKEFYKQGYKVVIITASFTHKRECLRFSGDLYHETVENIDFIWIKVPKYKKIHGIGRIRNWGIFSYKLANLYEDKEVPKPNVVYYSSLSLIGYIGAEKLVSKLKIPLVFEVRDIWPLTLQELKGLSSYNIFILFLRRIELRAYRNSNIIVSNLSNFKQYLVENNIFNKEYFWIPNGLDEVKPIDYTEISTRNPAVFKIGYSGALGIANAMDIFVEAANLLKGNNFFEFYILGSGPEKEKLKETCVNKNVFFLNPVDKSEVHSFLKSMDATYIGWNESCLYNYGIGANKIVDYLQSGKPILHSYSGLGDPIKDFELGLTVPAADVLALRDAMINISKFTLKEIESIKINSFNTLSNYYDYSVTTKNLISSIDKLI